MSKNVNPSDIKNNIKELFVLLSKQNYGPIGVELTREERKKLFEFFYDYDEYGSDDFKFDVCFTSQKPIDLLEINKYVFNEADDELKRIITKCGVNPNNVFISTSGDIDDKLLISMHNKGVLDLGDYVIKISQEHPIDRNSKEITQYSEKYQEEKYLRAKDGERTFTIYKKDKEELREIYYHTDYIHFGGYITFNGIQIGGTFSSKDYLFDKKGMMYKDIGIEKCINELIPFFEEITEVLTNNLEKEEIKSLKKS